MKHPTTQYNNAIHDLFVSFLDVYSYDQKYFATVMSLLDSYIQLGKQVFFSTYQNNLVSVYSTFFNVVSVRELTRLSLSIHSLLILFPFEGTQILSPMVDSILTIIFNKHQEERIERSLFFDCVINRLSESMYVSYLTIICQLLLTQDGIVSLGNACQKLQLGPSYYLF